MFLHLSRILIGRVACKYSCVPDEHILKGDVNRITGSLFGGQFGALLYSKIKLLPV